MPVNPVIRGADTWDNAEDPLVRQIQSSLFVPVLEPDDAAAEKAQPLSRWPRGEAEVEGSSGAARWSTSRRARRTGFRCSLRRNERPRLPLGW